MNFNLKLTRGHWQASAACIRKERYKSTREPEEH
jgi:hypothetical protein